MNLERERERDVTKKNKHCCIDNLVQPDFGDNVSLNLELARKEGIKLTIGPSALALLKTITSSELVEL